LIKGGFKRERSRGEVGGTRSLCCHAIGEEGMRRRRQRETKRGARGSESGALNGDHCY
jgi:hypothetical protein